MKRMSVDLMRLSMVSLLVVSNLLNMTIPKIKAEVNLNENVINVQSETKESFYINANQHQVTYQQQRLAFILPDTLNQQVEFIQWLQSDGEWSVPLTITDQRETYNQQHQADASYRQTLSDYQESIRQASLDKAIIDAWAEYDRQQADYHLQLDAFHKDQERMRIEEVEYQSQLEKYHQGELEYEPIPPLPTIDEPVMPVPPEDERPIIDEETMPNPFDADKERLWQIVLRQSTDNATTYVLQIPEALASQAHRFKIIMTPLINQEVSDAPIIIQNTVLYDDVEQTYQTELHHLSESGPDTNEADDSDEHSELEPLTVSYSYQVIKNEDNLQPEAIYWLVDIDGIEEHALDELSLTLAPSDLSNIGLPELRRVASEDGELPIEAVEQLLEDNRRIDTIKQLDSSLTFEWITPILNNEIEEAHLSLMVNASSGGQALEPLNEHLTATLDEINPIQPRAVRNDKVRVSGKFNHRESLNPNNSENLSLDLSFAFDNVIQQGDTFDLSISPNLSSIGDANEANFMRRTIINLFDASGDVIAEGRYVNQETIRFTFTEYIDQYSNVTSNLSLPLFINRDRVTKNEPIDIAAIVANQAINSRVGINYKRAEVALGNASIGSFLDNVDAVDKTYNQYIVVNPQNYQVYDTIVRVFEKSEADQDSGAQIAHGISSYQIYRISPGHGVTLSASYEDAIRYGTLVTDIKGKINRHNDLGNYYYFNFGDKTKDGSAYIIKISSVAKTEKADLKVISDMTTTGYNGYRNHTSFANYHIYDGPKSTGNSIPLTSLKIKKVNSENLSEALPSATLHLVGAAEYTDVNGVKKRYDQTLTSATGIFQFNRLRPGTYYLEELNAPKGYLMPGRHQRATVEVYRQDNQSLAIRFVDQHAFQDTDGAFYIVNQDGEYLLKNHPLKTSFGFIKLQSGTNQVLKDARFEVTKVDDEGRPIGSPVKVTSDQNGYVDIEDLTIGSYRIVETEAPPHHLLNRTPITFEVIPNRSGDRLIITNVSGLQKVNREWVFYNDPIPTASLSFTKVGRLNPSTENTYRTLNGAKFQLTSVGKNDEGQPLYQQVISSPSGHFEFNELVAGDYILEELTAPKGYQLAKRTFTVAVTLNQAEEKRELTLKENHGLFESDKHLINQEGQYYITNEPLTTTVELFKVDADTNEALEGAIFKLERLQDDEIEWVAEVTSTGDKGLIQLENLTQGNYLITEITSPEGYQLGVDPISFSLSSNEANDALVVTQMTQNGQVLQTPYVIVNHKEVAAIELLKVDGHSLQPLTGAEFLLESLALNQDGLAVYRKTITMDDQASVEVKDLPLGKYRLTETKAPRHYTQLQSSIEFELVNVGAEVQIVLAPQTSDLVSVESNQVMIKNYHQAEFPKTGGIGSVVFIALGFGLMVLGIYGYKQLTKE